MALLLGGLVGCGGPSTPVTTPVAPVTTAFQLLTPNFSALPQAVVDTPYDYALETDLGSPGVTAIGPVTFEATGAMPPGLTISRNGVISGAPAQAGSFTVPVKVIDSSSSPQTAAASYTIVVRLPGVSLTQVAHTDLGGHGQNAAVRVAVSRASGVSYAYVGTRGTAGDCPATGVKIVDLSHITNPQLVATAGAVSGASQENVRIGTGLSTPDFHSGGSGDMMAVTEQPCDPSNSNAQNAGVQFYDVTNPASPALLGTWSSGLDGVDDVAFVAVPGPTNAVGQVDHTQDNLYALVAVPGSETSTAGNGQGDLRVLDITNPADPRQIGSWGVLAATDTQLAQVVAGYDPRVLLASINLSSDGKTAYLGYWDEGVIVLNVSDPTTIANNNSSILLNHITYPITALATTSVPAEPEGNTREALPMMNDTDLLIADQVCASVMQPSPSNPSVQTPENPAVALDCGPPVPLTQNSGWGYVRTYSLGAQGAATIDSFFDNPQSMSYPPPDDGIYTAHTLAWNGNTTDPHAYVAWYSAGVEDLDITSINPPTRLASFVPPDTPDPNGSNPQVDNPDKALVDGVAAYSSSGSNYILVSDMNSGLWIVQETPASQLTFLTTSLPAANVGVPYSAQLASINGALGSSHLQYQTTPNSPNVPLGLSLSSDGAITGTPTTTTATSGPVAVVFQVNDGTGNSATQTIPMTVVQQLAIVPLDVTTAAFTPPVGTINEAYSLTLTGVNGTSPYTWSVVQGKLPPGVSISTGSDSEGVISGTPTTSGTYTATVEVADSEVPAATATMPLTIQIAGLTAQSTTLPNPVVGASYQASVTMENGVGPYTPALSEGTLPPGLSVSTSPSSTTEWQFTGTPTQAGTYRFSILVTDADGQSATVPFTMVVNPFAIIPAVLPTGVEGNGYQEQLGAQGGTSPYQFRLALGSLPTGLSLSQAGVISGVPAAGSAGNYNISIQAQDANDLTVTQAYTLTIFNPNVLAITTVALPDGQAGQSYDQAVTADFGTAPYTFSILSGNLPAGISFSPSGFLQGIPATPGTFTFAVQVKDSTGATATRQLTWTVDAAGTSN